MRAEQASDEPVERAIIPHFPVAPSAAPTPAEGREMWQLSREWGGCPELEWTFGIFRERITAFGGRVRAYFYEDIHDFETTRLLVRLSNVLIAQRQPSYPTVGVGFEYFDSAYRVPDGRLRCDDTPYRGRHAVVAVDHDNEDEIRFMNSWNPPYWGDGGYGYITRDYFERHVDAVYARWSASGGPAIPFRRCASYSYIHPEGENTSARCLRVRLQSGYGARALSCFRSGCARLMPESGSSEPRSDSQRRWATSGRMCRCVVRTW